ncbi:MAG: hypothetical protein ABIR32_15150 [Ilumatobacteraceae bacterium]
MIGLVAACAMLSACSADKVDYKTAAEKVARETVEGLIPGDATADCGDPSSPDVGTTFACTGTASDLTVYTFAAEITKAKEVTVTLLDTGTPPAGATGATSTDTGGTEATLHSEETVAETTTAVTAAG